MAISKEDRTAIHELLALHGHLMDGGELDRLSELFTDEVVYDLSPLGGSILQGVPLFVMQPNNWAPVTR